jgi:hypothetical protein
MNMNVKTGTIVAISLIAVALAASSYSRGWVNFGPREPPLAVIKKNPEGAPALGDRDSLYSDSDSDDRKIGNLYDSDNESIPDERKYEEGGSRKRRRIKGIKHSKKRNNKISKRKRNSIKKKK